MPPKSTRRVSVERALRLAIERKLIVRFNYSGLERICEPHVLGIANGATQILCWQSDGGSRRGGLPQWRRFELSGITGLRFTRDTFPGPRPVPFPHSRWDEVLVSV